MTVADVYTWTVPALKQAKHIRKMNMTLRAENKALKKEIVNLKTQLGQLAHWFEEKGAILSFDQFCLSSIILKSFKSLTAVEEV